MIPRPNSGTALTGRRVILGIDPGSLIMGYGILVCEGKNFKSTELGVVKMKASMDSMSRMSHILESTSGLIAAYGITEMAIESQFFGKNVQSMLKLGRAQGIAIAAALHHRIPVYEYAPRRIKQSITGRGNASKEQVAEMLKRLCNLAELPHDLDATDGLAVALCHHFMHSNPIAAQIPPELVAGPKKALLSAASQKKYGSWSSFLTENPEKLRK